MSSVKHIYIIITIILWISYFAAYFGVYSVNPSYITNLSICLRLLVCGFLIYRFHPFRTHHLESDDGRIIFGSAVIILTDMGIAETVRNWMKV
jgi:hypothetical protein